MKYNFSQVKEALNNGKVIYFQGPKRIDENRCYLSDNKRFVEVLWHNGDKIQTTAYSIEYVLGNFKYCVWLATDIEGEETMEKKTTPHKHADVIKKWADGAIIQYRCSTSEIWCDCDNNHPSWQDNAAYRVKPTLVKKWRWVYRDSVGQLEVTDRCYTEQDFNKQFTSLTLIQKIDSTMIEVEE